MDALRIYFNNPIPKKKKKTNKQACYNSTQWKKISLTNEHKSQVAITLLEAKFYS